jgi:hypothetical protein
LLLLKSNGVALQRNKAVQEPYFCPRLNRAASQKLFPKSCLVPAIKGLWKAKG